MNIIKLFSMLLCLIACYTSYAQSNKKNVNYTYDAAGNRKTRNVTITLNKKANQDTTTSIYNDKVTSKNAQGITVKHDISIYPNPIQELLSIKLTNGADDLTTGTTVNYYLVDVYGKVLVEQVSFTDGIINLNTINLLPGFYFLNVVTNFEKKSYRIIKI
jgi:hypothetical protein